jgi:hypothetical protein
LLLSTRPPLVKPPDRTARRVRTSAKTSHSGTGDDNSRVARPSRSYSPWTEPKELPGALTGDRHTAKYAPDGRLFVSFRDTTLVSPTRGDWVAWVGTYDDIVKGREGQYRVRLMRNHKGADRAYPGMEGAAGRHDRDYPAGTGRRCGTGTGSGSPS